MKMLIIQMKSKERFYVEVSENGIEPDEPECRYVSDPDHVFDMEVRVFSIKLHT